MTDSACHVTAELDDDRRKRWRAACKGLPIYAEHEAKPYCVLHFPGAGKECDFMQDLANKLACNDYDFRGVVFPISASNFEKRQFDAEVSFTKATFHGKVAFSEATFKRKADFSEATFKREADFSEAKFENTEKKEAEEGEKKAKKEAEDAKEAECRASSGKDTEKARGARKEAQYKAKEAKSKAKKKRDAHFAKAVFEEEGDFEGTLFKGEANFRKATFKQDADFSKAIFDGEADFRKATFEGSVEFEEPEEPKTGSNPGGSKRCSFNARVNFSMARFAKRATFVGGRVFDIEQERVTFRDALIEKPENFSLDRVQLRPSWFIDTNVRNIRFSNVVWQGLSGTRGDSIDEEIAAIQSRREDEDMRRHGKPDYAADILARACRELLANAEENRDYPTANRFHYSSMEAERRKKSRSAFAPWRLTWWYWALSGYNERPVRAVIWLLGIFAVFAAFYMWVGPVGISESSLVGVLQAASESLVYSFGVMTRIANDIPKDASLLARFLIIFEGVLGPFQIALFALALRRRFMR